MQLINKYFDSLSESQISKFMKLGVLYESWNQRVNLVSRKDITNIYIHHVLHSLSIARVINFKPGTKVIDAGTGGGFPGIPLAVMFPDVHFILADSINKKTSAVENIAFELGLENCEIRNSRLEKITDKIDFVVCRALADFTTVYSWLSKNILPHGFNQLPNGMFFLKGGDLVNETKCYKGQIRIFELRNFFDEEFFQTKKILYVSDFT